MEKQSKQHITPGRQDADTKRPQDCSSASRSQSSETSVVMESVKDDPENISIKYTHFQWLNHEVLRLGELAREYWDRGDRLQKENARLQRLIAEEHNR